MGITRKISRVLDFREFALNVGLFSYSLGFLSVKNSFGNMNS